MTTPLHERLRALRDFLAPPCANALAPPALDLLEEAAKALTPAPPGKAAPTQVEMPWASLSAGIRLVTGAYTNSQVIAYGNARAAERDAMHAAAAENQPVTLNVYSCTGFRGRWPVGTSAVILAHDEHEACQRMEAALADVGMRQEINPATIIRIHGATAGVVVLNDGEY